jgi:hypothetical protein
MFSKRSLDEVLEELMLRESIFHRPDPGNTRRDFENMIVADFCEVGASGRLYTRGEVLDALEGLHASRDDPVSKTSNPQIRELAPDLFLLTYSLVQDKERRTRRASLWQRMPEGWKILYHQGTIVTDSDSG